MFYGSHTLKTHFSFNSKISVKSSSKRLNCCWLDKKRITVIISVSSVNIFAFFSVVVSLRAGCTGIVVEKSTNSLKFVEQFFCTQISTAAAAARWLYHIFKQLTLSSVYCRQNKNYFGEHSNFSVRLTLYTCPVFLSFKYQKQNSHLFRKYSDGR